MQRATVLVVDDEPAARGLLCELVRLSGAQVVEARCGGEALERLRSGAAIDAVISDVRMSGMDGLELTRRLKAEQPLASVPILVVTALHDREVRLAALAAGAEDFVTKPIDRAELAARLRNLLRMKAAADTLAGRNERLQQLVEARTREVTESERRFRGVLEGLPLAAVMLDRDGRVTYANRSLEALAGRDRRELEGQPWVDTCLPAEERPRARAHLERLLAGEVTPERHEGVLVGADGRLAVMAWSDTLLRSAEGEVVGVAAVGEDVTEVRRRERSQAALREVAELLQDRERSVEQVLADVASALGRASGPRGAAWIRVGDIAQPAGPHTGPALREPLLLTGGQAGEVAVTASDADPALLRSVAGSVRLYMERRSAEDARRIVDAAIDAAVLPVAFADLADGRLTRVNAAFVRLWRFAAPEACLGRRLVDLWDSSAEAEAVFIVLRDAQNWSGELAARCCDGQRRDVHLAANVVRDPEGVAVAIMATFDDVTELRRIQARHDEAQRIGRLGHWDWDVVTGGLVWSLEVFRIFGLAPSRFGATYTAFLEAVHPDDRAAVERAVDLALRREAQYSIDHRIVLPGGVVRTVHEQAEVTFDGMGRPVRMLGTVQDVTELRGAEEALRERTALLNTVLAGAPVALCATDGAGFYTFSEGRALATMGLAQGELVGQRFEEVHRDRAELLDAFRRVAAGATARLRAHLGAGTFDVVFVPRAGGGVIGVTVDQTEREQLEAQLLQSQKMEALGRLAGGVAHDFNNLLTVITCASTFLADGFEVGDARREDVEAIAGAAARGEALTRQLLMFSRRHVTRPDLTDVDAVVAGMEPLLRRLIGEDVSLELQRAYGPCLVLIDPAQLEQAVLNLVVNARDAMPTGGRVTVGVERVAVPPDEAVRAGVSPGAFVAVSVRDTGSGVPDHVRPRLFEPFFTTKPAGYGTGLGLSTVWGIAAQAGGTVHLGAPARGALFTILLPERVGAPSAAASGPELAPELATTLAGRVVLVVEDEEGPRAMARRCLEAHGCQVVAAANADAALLTLAASEVDVVVTDVVLPGRSGRELADLIQRARPDLPIVFMTGYTDDTTLRYGVAEHAVRLVRKPFTPGGLRRAVADALRDRRRA